MTPVSNRALPECTVNTKDKYELYLIELYFTKEVYAHLKRQILAPRYHQPKSVGHESFILAMRLKLDELKCFLGILIMMGIIRLLSIRDYWSVDAGLAQPQITRCMTQQWFKAIFHYLHYNNNEAQVKWTPFPEECLVTVRCGKSDPYSTG